MSQVLNDKNFLQESIFYITQKLVETSYRICKLHFFPKRFTLRGHAKWLLYSKDSSTLSDTMRVLYSLPFIVCHVSIVLKIMWDPSTFFIRVKIILQAKKNDFLLVLKLINPILSHLWSLCQIILWFVFVPSSSSNHAKNSKHLL